MDDAAKMQITRSQLVDESRKCSRVQMVSDRIYRNHLKTRFFNLQEQKKLNNKIVELEKLEQDAWREMNHRRKEVEKKSVKIEQAIKINQVNNSPSITSRSRSQPAITAHRRSLSTRTRGPPRIQVDTIQNQCSRMRKPSFTSLMKPYSMNDTEYKQIMGYAQHFSKKAMRKSSTIQTNIEFDDFGEYSRPQYSKSQVKIFRGLKKTAKGLVSRGLVSTSHIPAGFDQHAPSRPRTTKSPASKRRGFLSRDTKQTSQRRISALPAPPNFEEENARYIRIPGSRDELEEGCALDETPEEPHRRIAITYEQQLLSVDEVITPGNLHSRVRRKSAGANHLHAPAPNLGRRGSRSLCEVEMKRYLPYLGRSPSPVSGLNVEFSDKLALFNRNLDKLRHRDSLDRLPQAQVDHTAPPPRDDPLFKRDDFFRNETDNQEEESVERKAVTPVRISVVDRFELSKWRQSMAVHDTLPVIKTCKYIRNPSKERYDVETNQFYAIDSDTDDDEEEEKSAVAEPLPAPVLSGSRIFSVVQDALTQMRAIQEDLPVK